MTEQEFRQKYPHSTDEQVRLYCEAVEAAKTAKPIVEPDIPMPLITVPERPVPRPVMDVPHRAVTTYTVPRDMGYITRNFSLDDVPPEGSGPLSTAGLAGAAEMRDILLGPFNSHLSPEQRQRFETTDMSADDMLALFFDPKQIPGGLGAH